MTKNCWWRHWEKLWRHNLISKYSYFKKAWIAIFAVIIKIAIMFIKTIIKDSRKVKRFRNYLSKSNIYLHFWMWQNFLISGEKMLISAELKECVTWFIYFLDLPYVRYNYAKFHHCRICVTDFREVGPKKPPPSVSSPKKAHPE